jgi:hypothetical protein
MEPSIVSLTQSRSLFRTFRALLILGIVMVFLSFVLPFRPQLLALRVALALVAMVLASASAYVFFRFLLGRGQGSFLHISQCFGTLGLAAISISLAVTYVHKSFLLSAALAVVGILLELIGGYFLYRFQLGRGKGTYSDIKAARQRQTSGLTNDPQNPNRPTGSTA